MKTKFQVFLSSTYEDLKPQRDQVIKAILEMGHIPVGMEMFSAADEEQWELIKRTIDDCDYYLVIVAHRYGSVDKSGVSYTEKEYDYACANGIPTLGFVLEPNAAWPPAMIESDQKAQEALAKFTERVKGKMVSVWTSADDLHAKVCIALSKAITSHPRPGWVRATGAAGPEGMAEVSRLSKENGQLRAQLQTALAQSARATGSEWEEEVKLLSQNRVAIQFFDKSIQSWTHGPVVDLYELFRSLGTLIVREESIETLQKRVDAWMVHLAQKQPSSTGTSKDPRIPTLRDVLLDFYALELVEPYEAEAPIDDDIPVHRTKSVEFWKFTTKGQRFYSWQRVSTLKESAKNSGRR